MLDVTEFLTEHPGGELVLLNLAGKEATVKAMGTGFAHGVWLRDVGVLNNDWGRPVIVWSERGSRVCARLGIGSGHLSLTDDAGLVLAFAVVETEG